MLEKIKTLVVKLNKARYEYYVEDNPSMTDEEYDKAYAELEALERETGIVEKDSPTHNVGYPIIQSKFKKVKHNHLMLSLDKTKTAEGVYNFSQGKSIVGMFKEDGLTVSLSYDENGNFIKGETRGDGEIGEDVTENLKYVSNIPKKIKTNKKITVDGEIICTKKNFNTINFALPNSERFSHIRNYASGSLRQLNPNVTKDRKLSFIAWDLIEPVEYNFNNEFVNKIFYLQKLGFETVNYIICLNNNEKEENIICIEQTINKLQEEAQKRQHPIDGIVFKFNDINFGNLQGKTEHHFKNGIAWKPEEELVISYLKDIIYQVGKTGILCPVAIFDPVQIDGTTIERASLNNLSILEKTLGEKPFIGQEILISKRNQIIPKIEKAKDINGLWI